MENIICLECKSKNTYYDRDFIYDSYGNVVGEYEVFKCNDCGYEIINQS